LIHRLVPLFVMTLLVEKAAAQTPASSPVPPSGNVVRTSVTPARVKATVPDPEKLKKSAEHLTKMRAWVDQVSREAEQARRERDIVKLNCVNEALTQMKALLKVAEQADLALLEAVSKKDSSADAEYSRVSIARVKVESLRREASCIGLLAYLVDERTTVEVEVPNLPDPGISRPPAPSAPTPPVVRPRPASQYY